MIMRKHVCESLLALSLLVSMLAAAAPASAKTSNDMRAQVPFDFYVGGQLIPAGDCAVAWVNSDESGLRIAGLGGRQVIMTLSTAEGARDRMARPRLVFHKYGDQYFLASVWGANGDGRKLPESKRERNLRKETRVAQQTGAGAEIVTIDAR
jgi:hypothetical protein